MTYLILLYACFKTALEGWNIYGLVALVATVPVVVTVLQLAAFSHSGIFAKAERKLGKFLKYNSYVSSLNLFLFNKKVSKFFPARVRKAMKRMEGKDVSADEICTTFENYRGKRPVKMMKTGCVVHLIAVSVVMALNGYSLAAVAFIALGVAFVWWVLGIGTLLAKRLFINRESNKRKDFLYAISHNTRTVATFSLGSIEDVKTLDGDSVSALANGVESFLAANPDKSLAKVVLKSLYSANYTAATSRESVFALKEAMHKLKSYVS